MKLSDEKETSNIVNEKTFRLLVENVTDYAIFILDKNGIILTWNKGGERLKGYSASEIIGKHFSLFYTQEDLSINHPSMAIDIANKKGKYEEEGWRVKKDGSLFWASITIIKLYDDDQEFIGFGKITRDLSEKKKAEENLRQSEERIRFLVNNIQDYAIITLDLEGRILTWNRGAEKIKGYKSEEIIGKKIDLFYTPNDVAAEIPQKELKLALKNGRFEDESWRVKKDGTPYWANVIFSTLKNPSGEITGFSKITRDLTERKRAEEKLLQLNASLEQKVAERTKELEEAIKVRDQFLSIASHELNTPLTSLKLQSQIRIKKLEKGSLSLTEDTYKKMLQEDVKQINRLVHLVDDILEISRFNSGKLVLHKTICNLNDIVNEVTIRFSPQFEVHHTEVDVVFSTDKILGKWDVFRVDQVISNLVSNAIKYGSGNPISIKVSQKDQWGIVEVSDQGIGISVNDQERIFGQYERAISATEISGMGLGLFISKQLTESLGGKIKVESELGKGSTFTLMLPLEV